MLLEKCSLKMTHRYTYPYTYETKYINTHLHSWTIYNLAITFTVPPSVIKLTMTQSLGNYRTLIRLTSELVSLVSLWNEKNTSNFVDI